MEQVERIMAAIAFSRYSEGILRFASQLAKRLDCQLIVVNVINIRDMQAVSGIESMGYKVDPRDYVRSVERERRETLEKMLKTIDIERDRVKAVFHVGHPLEMLLKTIEEENIDMVVMGPKGRTDLRHVLVGSVAEKMFRHCPVPLVSYRTK
ncbi:MAG TPA: universal stress protein [Desulfobacterales bacterium]|nr:universal stress protein [Desulfobacterales bacterium]